MCDTSKFGGQWNVGLMVWSISHAYLWCQLCCNPGDANCVAKLWPMMGAIWKLFVHNTYAGTGGETLAGGSIPCARDRVRASCPKCASRASTDRQRVSAPRGQGRWCGNMDYRPPPVTGATYASTMATVRANCSQGVHTKCDDWGPSICKHWGSDIYPQSAPTKPGTPLSRESSTCILEPGGESRVRRGWVCCRWPHAKLASCGLESRTLGA